MSKAYPGLPEEPLWSLERLLSVLLVAGYAVAGLVWDGPATAFEIAVGSILPILCIWFPESTGRYMGMGLLTRSIPITRPTPGAVVRVVGWGFLLLPLVIAGVLVLTLPDVSFTGAMSERPPIACDLDVLAPAERERRAGLAERLEGAIVAVTELPNGYAISVDGKRLPLDDLKAFVELEGRCCSFLHFEIAPQPGPSTVLTVTGGEGVKEFLTAALGLGGR